MDKKLLDILVCPISHKPLFLSKDNKYLISADQKYGYPIINGIPHLTPDHVIDKPTTDDEAA
ncbi:MAG: hypothetical protein CBC42_07265 [Betaproteobacteria bacterium TMED82]|nr:MAG: hypothetical protein CBC42_07265 [Betaproteobacteria bacterium TMED82]|tara:strand:- start:54583 stop:54768 length:186 start_codon:yes stop_codon:yes gene_type:complete